MGFMDKVMFWKKNDDFEDLGGSPFDAPPGGSSMGHPGGMPPSLNHDSLASGPDSLGFSDSGLPPPSNDNFIGAPSLAPAFNQPSQMPRLEPVQPKPVQNQTNDSVSKDLEIISAKLDSIRSAIDSLNVRVVSIESAMRNDYERHKEARW